MSGFAVFATSHPTSWELEEGQLKFTISSPSGIPSMNTAPIDSRGFVRFKLNPLPGLDTFSSIYNQAKIHLNGEPPITTNNVWLYVNKKLTFESESIYVCEGDTVLGMPITSYTIVRDTTYPSPYDMLVHSTFIYAYPENETTVISSSICEGEEYIVEGLSFDTPGNYQILLQDQYGCDSLIDLDLFVNDLPLSLIHISEPTRPY